jgi:catalase
MKNDAKPTTTDAGIPVPSDEFSLTVGPDGPIPLQDHYLIEQMANFNRERIAERQSHAQGAGAFGYFEGTKNVSARGMNPNHRISPVEERITTSAKKHTSTRLQ